MWVWYRSVGGEERNVGLVTVSGRRGEECGFGNTSE